MLSVQIRIRSDYILSPLCYQVISLSPSSPCCLLPLVHCWVRPVRRCTHATDTPYFPPLNAACTLTYSLLSVQLRSSPPQDHPTPVDPPCVQQASARTYKAQLAHCIAHTYTGGTCMCSTSQPINQPVIDILIPRRCTRDAAHLKHSSISFLSTNLCCRLFLSSFVSGFQSRLLAPAPAPVTASLASALVLLSPHHSTRANGPSLDPFYDLPLPSTLLISSPPRHTHIPMQHCPTPVPPVSGTTLPTSGPLVPCASGSVQPASSALNSLAPPQANAIRGVEGFLASVIAQPVRSTQSLFVYLSSTMTPFPPPFMPPHRLTRL